MPCALKDYDGEGGFGALPTSCASYCLSFLSAREIEGSVALTSKYLK